MVLFAGDSFASFHKGSSQTPLCLLDNANDALMLEPSDGPAAPAPHSHAHLQVQHLTVVQVVSFNEWNRLKGPTLSEDFFYKIRL